MHYSAVIVTESVCTWWCRFTIWTFAIC